MAFNKADLLSKLEVLNFPTKEVVLTFDEFFTGNNCETSIGVNIFDKPSVVTFRETFQELLDEKLADAVYVRVVDVEDPEEWIFTDTVYVIGSLSMEELEEKIISLYPDQMCEGWMYDEPVNIGGYDRSKNIFSIFWD